MNLFVHVDWVVHVYARFRRKRAFCDAAKRKFLFVLFIFAFLANAELTVDSFTDPLMRPVESSSYEEYMQYYNATAGEGAAYFQSLDATAGQVKAVTVLYFFFGFLWTSQVLLALNGMIIAGAVCSWYWRVSINLPITKAATRTLLSHIGTVCFGSFIIALVKFVRYAARAILAQFCAQFSDAASVHSGTC